MTFKKGDKKLPNAGRVKGTPNKATLGVREFLETRNFNVLEKSIELYNKTNKEEVKVTILALLAKYCYPQFKAIEISAAGNNFEIVINRKKVNIDNNNNNNNEPILIQASEVNNAD
ncbi:MAG: hypothetical protein LUH05_04010 [Candidatus Gastranaerophilales bacterium]|nr:hypothetical protein [Candidatus Gastranaerophilales bacterium]